jgi:phospholipid transport system substrate-binding protein
VKTKISTADGRSDLKKILIGVIFILLSSETLHAGTPVDTIQGLWKEIQSYLNDVSVSREEFIKSALRRHYDFDTFYETALQDHWPSWSDSQKRDFAARFENLFLQSLTKKITRLPKSGAELLAAPATLTGARAVVSFTGKKGEKQAQFKVFFTQKDSEWKIYDVEVEGVLLSRNYRGQFNRILRNENYSGLITRLDRKLSS